MRLTDSRRPTALINAIRQTFRLAWRAHPMFFAGSIGLTAAQGLFPLASAWIVKLMFDLLAEGLQGPGSPAWASLVPLLVLQVAIGLISQSIGPLYNYLNSELLRRLTLSIDVDIYTKINSFAGIAHFERPEFYDTIQMARQGSQQSAGQSLGILSGLLRSSITIAGFIGVLIAFSPILAGLVVLAALPEFVAQLRLRRREVDLAVDLSPNERIKFFYGFLLSSVNTAKEIRMFGLAGHFLDRYVEHFRKTHRAERDLARRELRFAFSLNILSGLVSSGVFIIVIARAFQGAITLGDVTLYVGAVTSVQAGLNGLIDTTSRLGTNAVFFRHFADLMRLEPSITTPLNARPLPPLTIGLKFENVSFRYKDEHPWVLRNLSLVIPAGDCVALVGLNGAGKTTMAKLLGRLYDPTEGRILWDGVDIRELDPDALRAAISVVFQDFVRYDLSARENIGLGNLRFAEDLDRVTNAAKQADIHEKLLSLPDGYDTVISRTFTTQPLGIDISGGEWQKIAMARMLMRDADLLILDEPTAALDPKAEYAVFSQFRELVSAQTSLLVSHRFSTVRVADSIAVLDDGHIVEHGDHDELMALEGMYADLYHMQAERYLDGT